MWKIQRKSNAVTVEDWVVVSNIFYVHPYLGKIPILTNIFQQVWNHQLEDYLMSSDLSDEAL